jgi:hypothetical protein
VRHVTVVAKVSLTMIHEGMALETSPTPLVQQDVYYADGKDILTASEMAPRLPGVDVLLRGNAQAPQGRAAPAVATRLVIASGEPPHRVALDKTVHVYGDRATTDDYPASFVSIPVRYEISRGEALGAANGHTNGETAEPRERPTSCSQMV